MPATTTDVTNALTLEDIKRMLSETRTKGGYKVTIGNFATSGETYLIVSALPEYSEKSASAISQSLKGNLKPDKVNPDWPKMQVISRKLNETDEKESVLLVNLDALAASA